MTTMALGKPGQKTQGYLNVWPDTLLTRFKLASYSSSVQFYIIDLCRNGHL